MIMKPPFGTRIDWSNPVTRGLFLSYFMNEGCGNSLFDSSMNGHVGTLTNMSPINDWVNGDAGHALNYDGTNDTVDTPHSGVWDGLSQISFQCKVKFDQLSSDKGEEQIFLAKRKVAAPEDSMTINLNGSNKISFFLRNDTPTLKFVVANSVLQAGVWYVIICTYDGAFLRIYINGFLDGAPAAQTGAILDTDSTFRIGAYASNFLRLNGDTEFVNVWNKCLTPDEALSLSIDPYQIAPVLPLQGQFAGVLPGRIHINTLNRLWRQPNQTFSLVGFDFIWRDNQLIETSGGSNKYVMYDNVMILQ